jgi:hypothetical protein
LSFVNGSFWVFMFICEFAYGFDILLGSVSVFYSEEYPLFLFSAVSRKLYEILGFL